MTRIYLLERQCIVLNPGPESIPFLSMSTGFKVESVQAGPRFSPRFRNLAKEDVFLDRPLFELNEEELIAIYLKKLFIPDNANGEHKYSRLRILHALSLSKMSHCRSCGWECGINRFSGEKGKCGLGNQAFASRPFIHIAEEPVINPAVVTNFGGCSLRCTYCIESKGWNPENLPLLDPKQFWEEFERLRIGGTPINTLEFTNPTESLPGIIGLLIQAPYSLNFPLVMNCHSYGSQSFWEMAGPITDVWLPDLRYGNDKCAKALSGVENYMKYAKLGLDAMIQHDSKIIVRILVLPGHVSCCHEPAMELLSKYKDKVWVSVLDQYIPEHKAYLDPNLKRRPTKEEIEAVNSMVEKYGLRNILTDSKDFWRL
jgi:putative pyruvate formate lyase activating enzyme